MDDGGIVALFTFTLISLGFGMGYLASSGMHGETETGADKIICVETERVVEYAYFPGENLTDGAVDPRVDGLNLSAPYVLSVDDYRGTGGSMWVTVNTSAAPIVFPERMRLEVKERCTEKWRVYEMEEDVDG